MHIQAQGIYDVGHREVHMIGDNVAVCWNLRSVPVTAQPADASPPVTGSHKVRQEPGYIDFVWMRQDGDGTWYQDEDTIAGAGLTPIQAVNLAGELHLAAQYLTERMQARHDAASAQST